MIQYMAALKLKSMLPEVNIANVDIPEWGLFRADSRQQERSYVLPEVNEIDFDGIVSGFKAGKFEHVVYPYFAQRVENFLPREEYDTFFPPADENLGWDDRHILINIRGREILDARHPAYAILPIDFYASVIRETGLRPVFMGQIEDNVYMDAIRKRFPDAIYQSSRGPMVDFQTIRQSKNIIPAISSFSWLASWFSDGIVHLPLCGLLNPFQESDHNFIPFGRPKYRYYTFPILYAFPVSQFAERHERIAGRWRLVSERMLRRMIAERPRFALEKDDYIAAFDPEFYLGRYPDLLAAYGNDAEKAKGHYLAHGYDEGREGFSFNDAIYAFENPQAAESVGNGEFLSLRDQYLESCRAKSGAL